MNRREFLSLGWIRRVLAACTPDKSECDEGYDAENERTSAVSSLVEVEQEIKDLERELARARCRRAVLKSELSYWHARAQEDSSGEKE